MMSRLVIRLDCADRPGIVAGLTDILSGCRWNIEDLKEHTEPPDPEEPGHGNRFFLRIHAVALRDAEDPRPALERFACRQLNGHLKMTDPTKRLRIGLLMSKEPDCPMEILDRCRTGDISGDVVLMIANQTDLEWIRRVNDPPIRIIPNEMEGRQQAEREMVSRLEQVHVDLVVLARYMRVLSPWVIKRFQSRIINIHHSPLPAFPGSDPYLQGWRHGVKVIGATAHYATEELDDGPIIAQGTQPVEDHESVGMRRRSGARIERGVLAAAVQAHTEGRVIIHGRKTIVFRPDGLPYG